MQGLRLASRLPFGLLYRVGGILGSLGASWPTRIARFTQINLRLCLPELSEPERVRLARESQAESLRGLCEIGALWNWKADRVLGLVRAIEGEAHLETALAQGRGVILAGPHVGAWEMVGLYCSSRAPLTALYTPLPVDALNRFITNGRSRFGAQLVTASPGGLRRIVRALQRGEVVAVLADQDPLRGAGVLVPFFGVLANTATLIPRLARLTGAPVLIACAERLPRAQGFRLHFRPASSDVAGERLLDATAALNLDLERAIRLMPSQYLWSYKRFRVRPQGEANPYRRSDHVTASTP